MKIIITGGCGFIGKAVINTFLKSKKNFIINVDNLTYASSHGPLKDLSKKDGYIFEKANISDKKKITKIFNKYKPDAIIHLAAESHVDRSIDSSVDFIKTNILGTHNLLEVTRTYLLNRRKRFKFFHVSTDEVYGDLDNNKNGFTEKNSYLPSSPYSATKASADHLVRAWHRTYKMPVLISNCSNNYGSFQFPEKFIPHIILNAINGKKIPIYGDGSQVRDWLYVNDHAEAIKKIFYKGKIGETYNVGTGLGMSNIKLAKYICDIMNKKIKNKPKNIYDFKDLIHYVKDRPGHDIKYLINPYKILKKLKWKPKVNIENGIIKTIDWYLKNEIWWKKILNKNYKLKRVGKID